MLKGKLESNKLFSVLLILVILVYIGSIASGNAFIYVVCFRMLAGTILVGLLILAANLIWRLLPETYRKVFKVKRERFIVIFLLYSLLFYILSGITDWFLFSCSLKGNIHFFGISEKVMRASVRLLGLGTILVFAVLVGRSLIRENKIKTIIGKSILVILFMERRNIF